LEAGAILLIVILNAIMGIIQESRAEQSLAALKKLAAPEAQCCATGTASRCRPQTGSGRYRFHRSRQLHPGDIRLLEAVNLSIEEASLTGELCLPRSSGRRPRSGHPDWRPRKQRFYGTLVTYARQSGGYKHRMNTRLV
jgi:Ca2+-transporting ATPase